jgi:hypothetical protein
VVAVSEHTYSHVLVASPREETSDASSVKFVIMWLHPSSSSSS